MVCLLVDDKVIKNIESIIDTFLTDFNRYEKWDTFNFTDDEIHDLFDESGSLTLFENDENKSSIIISKSIFPLINNKTITPRTKNSF
jgi:hypothetical protein